MRGDRCTWEKEIRLQQRRFHAAIEPRPLAMQGQRPRTAEEIDVPPLRLDSSLLFRAVTNRELETSVIAFGDDYACWILETAPILAGELDVGKAKQF